ncbi:MAG: hypothetical protein QOH88_2117 [Verrucomicrobiota bacterium]|jgi:hypothetical protein
MLSSRFAPLVLALLAIFSAGCKSTDKPAKSSNSPTHLYAIAVESSAFFRRGPQPGLEPDLKLPKDTVVKLIRPSFGYSKVEVVSSGLKGYVASEEIKPASSSLLASATPAPVETINTQTNATAPAVEQFNLNSNDPRLVPPPEELPNPDLPVPAPSPSE